MGSQFESKVVQELCKILSILKTHTTPYHPQCDGLVERLNRTIQAMLATCINEHMGDWEEYLPRVCFKYNTSKQTSTGFAPFYLMFERQERIPLDVIFGNPTPELWTTSQHILNLGKSLEQAYKLARDHLGTAAERQKKRYDQRVHGESYKVGDQVWLHNPVVPRRSSKKLHCPWTGPFQIIKYLSDTVY